MYWKKRGGMMTEMKKITQWIVNNWDMIPDEYKEDIRRDYKVIKGLKVEAHFVVLLLDRQKPSVEAEYDFNTERIGVNRFGQIIWGFDSGCSCPSPWHDSFPDCYSCSNSWKEFEVNLKDFDKEWEKEVLENFNEIKSKVK